MNRVLIAVPSLRQAGGVANYYKVLRFDKAKGVEYFEVTGEQQTAVGVAWRLLRVFLSFTRRIKSMQTVLLNPSMGRRAVLRDSVLAWLALRQRKRLIVFWRGWDWGFFRELQGSRLLRGLLARTLLKADTTITLAAVFSRELGTINPYVKDRIVRETTVADDSLLNVTPSELATHKLALDAPTLLFMSRLEPEKGLIEALRAYAIVHSQLPRSRMIVAGDGADMKRAKATVEAENIPGVLFVGHVENQAKHNILLNSSLLLFPTRFGEGLPNAVLEAMLYGLPIVARHNAGISEVVEDGVNGHLTESNDPVELSALVLNILRNKEVQKRMVLANVERAREAFIPFVVRARMLSLLQCPP